MQPAHAYLTLGQKPSKETQSQKKKTNTNNNNNKKTQLCMPPWHLCLALQSVYMASHARAGLKLPAPPRFHTGQMPNSHTLPNQAGWTQISSPVPFPFAWEQSIRRQTEKFSRWVEGHHPCSPGGQDQSSFSSFTV